MEEKYIYFKIPESYKNLYYKLISYVANQGYSIMNDCSCLCKKGCRQIFNMWALFQSACALYAQGETDKSKFFIDYINKEFEHYIKLDNSGNVDYPEMNQKMFYFYVGVSTDNYIVSVDSLKRIAFDGNQSDIEITVPSTMSDNTYLVVAYPNKDEYVLNAIMKGNYDVMNSAFSEDESDGGNYINWISEYPGNFSPNDKLIFKMNSL